MDDPGNVAILSVLLADLLELLLHLFLQLRVLVLTEWLVESDFEGAVVLAHHSLQRWLRVHLPLDELVALEGPGGVDDQMTNPNLGEIAG